VVIVPPHASRCGEILSLELEPFLWQASARDHAVGGMVGTIEFLRMVHGRVASGRHQPEITGEVAQSDVDQPMVSQLDRLDHVRGETYEPIKENQGIYDELYKRVYLRMYSRLKPLYDEIREITGYPPRD